ncbi:MAG: deoxyribodipyrimidine photo-lyase [Bryobacterales bacterium]|nr:DNA photolyase family protein [Bryobacteraceae bacterium]MDW8354373.1 deoxyribodipyrimidine photo-lyase [Bryobacterales bacterium]
MQTRTTPTEGPAILWFRLDLRLADNPALHEASQAGGGVIPVYVHAPEEEGNWAPGAASRWWLHHSLARLEATLRERGSRLIFRRGPAAQALTELVRETRAKAVFWSRRYEPTALRRDAEVRATLAKQGVAVRESCGSLLFEPWQWRSAVGRPFRVFRPFWINFQRLADRIDSPLPAPRRIPAPDGWPDSLRLEELSLLPNEERMGHWLQLWQPGEAGAHRALNQFLESGLRRYGADRDRPDKPGTSKLSPHLHFGEISPRQLWNEVRSTSPGALRPGSGAAAFLRELAWREFAHHVLYYFPEAVEEPLKPEFRTFPWSEDDVRLQQWQQGQTGYPIVDAGMRELWQTGWLANRVRMVVASFLVKHLRIRWQKGAAWFWQTLVDADLANNTLNWQWVAGCGVDAAPYFRIFHPVKQGEKFDPNGEYVRRWIPELAGLPADWIHRPWEAPSVVLAAAGVELGTNYPRPVVEHAEARAAALRAFQAVRGSRPTSPEAWQP